MSTRRFSESDILLGLFTLGLAFMLIGSCQEQSRGFILPEGNTDNGKELFSEFQCSRCHEIADLTWTGSMEAGDPRVALGGEVTALKSYGELVTSVINPSHKISQKWLKDQHLVRADGHSSMELYRYNDVMTVDELIDIVAFLQSQYKLAEPEYPTSYQPF